MYLSFRTVWTFNHLCLAAKDGAVIFEVEGTDFQANLCSSFLWTKIWPEKAGKNAEESIGIS